MQILLTNDDGIDAEGLQSLARELSGAGKVIVVAPARGCSCCGHSVTTASPLVVREVREDQYAVEGWPADCVRVAIHHLKLEPDWVLSGINHGGNLGVDILMSGTVAAAREASLHGLRALAISQYRKPSVNVSWHVAAKRAHQIFRSIANQPLAARRFWNANLPSIPDDALLLDPIACEADREPFHYQLIPSETGLLYQSNYQTRPHATNTDVFHCFSGHATLTELSAAHKLG